MKGNKTYYCYNTKTKESFKCNSMIEVTNLTGLETNHVFQISKSESIYKDTWLIIDKDNYSGLSELKSKLRISKFINNGEIMKIIFDYKNRIREEVYKSIITKYPNDIGSKPIYIVKDEKIIKTVYTYEEVSEILNIPIGTVRSRLYRTVTWKILEKSCCIKKESWDYLNNNK